MRKSQKKVPAFKGEITAFLALLFVLMISLVGALIESASIQMTKNIKRVDTVLALESAFAEYDKEMLERYDIFVKKGCSIEVLRQRMDYYGATNMAHTMIREERLTDNDGCPFREQAIRYAKNWLGMDAEFPDTNYEFYSENYLEEEELVNMDLEELLAQDEGELPEEGNPLSSVNKLKASSLISLVCENPEELSERSIDIDSLPSKRTLETGSWGKQSPYKVADRPFFAAYLTQHFGSYVDAKDSSSLLYEQEYLIGGHASDRENLEATCKRILSVRMATNYGYLLTDTVKQAEAETLALSLCSLLTVPGITEVVKHAILLAWAYGESVVDVRVLLKGKRVPAIKSTDTWQLQLANLIKLGTNEEVVSEADVAGGLSYQNYLTGLLTLGYNWTLSMRSLDLIESNLHIKTDECMTKVEIESKAVLRRGVKDTFLTTYGYK